MHWLRQWCASADLKGPWDWDAPRLRHHEHSSQMYEKRPVGCRQTDSSPTRKCTATRWLATFWPINCQLGTRQSWMWMWRLHDNGRTTRSMTKNCYLLEMGLMRRSMLRKSCTLRCCECKQCSCFAWIWNICEHHQFEEWWIHKVMSYLTQIYAHSRRLKIYDNDLCLKNLKYSLKAFGRVFFCHTD